MKEEKGLFTRVYLPVLLFITALAFRLLYLRDLFKTIYFDHLISDSQAYHESALAILDGLWSASWIYTLASLYSFFLAAIYALAGVDFLVVRLVQCVLGSLSVVLIYFLAARFFNYLTAAIAAVLYLFYGILIFYDGQFLAASPAIFTTLLLIFFLARIREDRLLPWLPCGILLGMAILLRPNNLLLIPLLFIWILFLRKDAAKKKVYAALLFCVGAALMVSPVTVRNYMVDGDWLLLSPNGGITFFLGNNPNANGRYTPVQGVALDTRGQARDARKVAEEALGRPLKPSEVSDYWMEKGRAFIRENPLRALRLFGLKCLLFWNREESRLIQDFQFHQRFSSILRWAAVRFGLMIPFAMTGLVLSFKRWRALYLLYVAILANFLTVLLFFMSDRYRLPAVPFLLIFAAYGIHRLGFYFHQRTWRAFSCAAILLAAGFFIARLNLAGETPNVSAYYHMGSIYERSGLTHKALAAYEKAILINAVAKADAIVTGECLRIDEPAAASTSGEEAMRIARFQIQEVLKGDVRPSTLFIPCLPPGSSRERQGDKNRLPTFFTKEQFLLFLRKSAEGDFYVMGGQYGRYHLVRQGEGEPAAFVHLPLSDLQSGLPDANAPIPLDMLKQIIEEIQDSGDFQDQPPFIDTSLSKKGLEILRKKRQEEAKKEQKYHFW